MTIHVRSLLFAASQSLAVNLPRGAEYDIHRMPVSWGARPGAAIRAGLR